MLATWWAVAAAAGTAAKASATAMVAQAETRDRRCLRNKRCLSSVTTYSPHSCANLSRLPLVTPRPHAQHTADLRVLTGARFRCDHCRRPEHFSWLREASIP